MYCKKKNKNYNSVLILRNVLFLKNIIEKTICIGSLNLEENDISFLKTKIKLIIKKMQNKLYYYRKKLRSENVFK